MRKRRNNQNATVSFACLKSGYLSAVETTNFYIDKVSHGKSKIIHEQNMMERGINQNKSKLPAVQQQNDSLGEESLSYLPLHHWTISFVHDLD